VIARAVSEIALALVAPTSGDVVDARVRTSRLFISFDQQY